MSYTHFSKNRIETGYCISSGCISQADVRFGKSRNVQCVCISVTACAYVQNCSKDIFSSNVIDRIIEQGNSYYNKTKNLLGPSHKHAYLSVDEVASTLNFENWSCQIETTWIASECYPTTINEFHSCVVKLADTLGCVFETDCNSCLVFMGLNSAVSLWRSGSVYFLFNSHSVDEENNASFDGVGRLFKCPTLVGLAFLLLKNSVLDGLVRQYELHRVVSSAFHFIVSSQVNLPPNFNPVVVLQDIIKFPPKQFLGNVLVPSKRTSGVGRPPKKVRGRPKTSSLTTDEQHRDAVKRYTVQNPDVHQKSVEDYAKKHPDVNRKSVEKYTKNHPDVNRTAVKIYSQNHPEINQKAVDNYRKKHPGRHLPTVLRKGGLIAEYSGEKLNSVKEHRLKNQSLMSDATYKCSYCNARLFDEEKENKQMWCCGQGSYNVLDLPPLTEPFYENRQFLLHPRMYNDLFAFCALDLPGSYQHPKGLSFIKILGRIYHKVYDLSNESEKNTGRLYIDDGEARIMLAEKKKLNVAVISEIKMFLESCNPYVPLYKQLYNEPAEEAHLIFKITSRRIDGPILGERQLSTEVAAVISCDTEPFEPSTICIWKKGAAQPHSVSRSSPLVEPFQYPLLYPQGTPGWTINRTDKKGKKLSLLKYTRCLLLSESRFSKFGRLSETWLVDMYARIDEERLQYIRYSQLKRTKEGGLRTATLDEIAANCSDRDIREQTNAGRDVMCDETVQGDGGIVAGRIYLPSTYTGGPRYMKVAYLDAMALVSRFGTPTYFLTFTAFGGWDENRRSMNARSKQEAAVVNRVFKLKIQELLNDIRCGKFFGNEIYIVWSIEFQLRGLPHIHICFRVENGGPVQCTEIDRVIRADIPKADEADGRLRRLVLKHMTHGPCGVGGRTDLPCWDPELQKCTKFFPKPHTETTHTDDRGFVQYKRDSGNKAEIPFKSAREGIVVIDDRWVVPYNAALLLKYECHINLEIASARRVVKYLFKYISKGPPLRRMAIVQEGIEEIDEVEEYVTKRIMGATDACWRVLEFPITGRKPTVETLPVHLDGKQSVYFHAGREQEAINKSTSRLLIYFDRPQSTEMDKLTYLDFYEKYLVKTSKPKSSKVPVFEHPDGLHYVFERQRGECVARMFWIAPSRGEQYFLRMLLAKYPCRGYKDLYNLGGRDCNTFQQAARALGLADDRREFSEALAEASKFMEAARLRQFFVLLIQAGCPAPDMWSEFKSDFCEDFLEIFPDDEEKASKLALIQIDRCLRRQGLTLLEAGLPVVQDNYTELGRERLEYSSSVEKRFVDEWEGKLSSDQLAVFNHLKELLSNQSATCSNSKVIFVDGPGGSGKTLLLRVIASLFRSSEKVVLCVASSGIAAQNLRGGTTAHSMFRLPLEVREDSYWSVTNKSQRGELIREAALVIYDEAPMSHKYVIEMVDRSMRDLMGNDDIFGGKIIVFAGDFRQIPPVVENAKTPSEIVHSSVRKSFLWNQVKPFTLTTSHRLIGDNVYSDFLLKLGSNMVKQHLVSEGRSNERLIALDMLHHVTTIEDLIDFVFPGDILAEPDECASRVILCTLNANVKEINRLVINSLGSEVYRLYSVDSIVDDEETGYEIDELLLNQAEAKSVPDHVLQLKIGAICIVMRNLNFDLGLVNGAKVIVVSISNRLITCRKPGSSECFGIPRISFKFSITLNSPIEMIRRQFPLQLSYAMTIHKSQGQTIDKVGLDLRTDCFTHGQLYVGLSRVRSPDNIRVLVPAHRVINKIAYTKNIVYPDLL